MTSRLIFAVVLTAISVVMLRADAAPDGADAAFPGGNGLLAYVETQSGETAGIYTNNAEGTDPQRLTTTFAYTPHWSPDGQKLVWSALGEAITVANADGSDQQVVATGQGPSWHPDGERIVYYKQDGDIYIGDPPAETNLTNTPGYPERNPVVSPDGTKIAYVRQPFNSPPVEIWIMNIDGSDPHPITNGNDGHYFAHPDWSPDGTQIAFTHFVDGGPGSAEDIWVMNADGTSQQNLTQTPGLLEDYPAWSPDGERIAFHRNRMASNFATPQGDPPGDTWTMAADGTDRHNVSQGTGITSFDNPDWQPLSVPPPELIWGDADCDHDVDEDDALALVLHHADIGATVQQIGQCPAIGAPEDTVDEIWGDWNCDGTPDSADAVRVLAHLGGVPISVPSCPDIETPANGGDPLAGGVLAEFDVVGESVHLWTARADTIQQLLDLEAGTGNSTFPIGPLLLGPGPGAHNLPRSWHFDPAEVTMTEAAIELCDATPSYVEQHPADFATGYCPWSATLVSLTDYR